MNEPIWARAAAYSAIAIITVASWAVAQTSVDRARAELPIMAYIDCLEKFATIKWPEQSGRLPPNPSGSEVCGELASRQKAD